MPRYEYSCDECGFELELDRSVADRNEELRCYNVGLSPIYLTCQGILRLQVSKTSFVLKGDGWAKDGYGSKR